MSCEAAAGEMKKCFYSLSLDWVRLGALGRCFSLLVHMPQPLALHCLFRSVLGIFGMDCSKACPYSAFLEPCWVGGWVVLGAYVRSH